MPINFSKLTSSTSQVSLEPRDIFMALPTKDKNYGYPRDVQTEVWKQWFAKRDEKNVIIKMNTGSGKTVVGLTILQSSLNEGKGPAVYIVPDNYLVQQVCSEAKNLEFALRMIHLMRMEIVLIRERMTITSKQEKQFSLQTFISLSTARVYSGCGKTETFRLVV